MDWPRPPPSPLRQMSISEQHLPLEVFPYMKDTCSRHCAHTQEAWTVSLISLSSYNCSYNCTVQTCKKTRTALPPFAETFGLCGNFDLKIMKKNMELFAETFLKCGNETKCLENVLFCAKYGNSGE